MEGLSLDQIRVLLAVVDQGSFSAASRHLGRAQSAITYAVQKLEEQLGAPLFDRTFYRPALTEAGRALLPRARRIAEEVGAFRALASGLTAGLEAELRLVIDSMFPMCGLLSAMKAFSARFPSVPTRIHVESLGAAARLVLDGTCAIGLLNGYSSNVSALRRLPLDPVELIPVVSPDHALAASPDPVPTEILRDHVQLVLTDRSNQPDGRDEGVLSTRTWRLGDLGAKHAMLLAGLGWGSLPAHMIRDDLATGRLKRLRPADWGSHDGVVMMPMYAAHRVDAALGPAANWMLSHWAAARGLIPAAA